MIIPLNLLRINYTTKQYGLLQAETLGGEHRTAEDRQNGDQDHTDPRRHTPLLDIRSRSSKMCGLFNVTDDTEREHLGPSFGQSCINSRNRQKEGT